LSNHKKNSLYRYAAVLYKRPEYTENSSTYLKKVTIKIFLNRKKRIFVATHWYRKLNFIGTKWRRSPSTWRWSFFWQWML